MVSLGPMVSDNSPYYVLIYQTSRVNCTTAIYRSCACDSLFRVCHLQPSSSTVLLPQVRERLRSAIERNSLLEDELMLANQELKALQEELERARKAMRRRSAVRMSFTVVDEAAFSKEQVSSAVYLWMGQ